MAEGREGTFVFRFCSDRAPSLLSAEKEVALAQTIERGRKKAEKAEKRRRNAEARVKRARTRVGRARAKAEIRAAEVERRAAETEVDEAERRFVEANVRLAISLARKYVNRGLGLADLVQEGSIGLLVAVRKFEWQRGYRFSTYAAWWVRQYCRRAIYDKSEEVRIPVHMREQIQRLERERNLFMGENDREPEDGELAREIGCGEDHVREVREIAGRFHRRTPIVNQFQEDDPSVVKEDALPDKNGLPQDKELFLGEIKRCIDELLPRLDPVERDILKYRLQQEYALSDIGEWHHLSRERIRQKQVIVERKLRSHLAKRLALTKLPEDES